MPDRKEAALKLTSSEKCLKAGKAQESLTDSTAALEIFRSLGPDGVEALPDVLRTVIEGKRMLALQLDQELTEVQEFAEAEKSNFAKAGDKRGEAAMLISLAEIASSRCSRPFASGPLPDVKPLEEALHMLRDVGDKKLEGLALLAMSETYMMRPALVEAKSAADAALKVFEELGDSLNKAKALRAGGRCSMASGKVTAGEQAIQAAIATFRQQDARRLEAEEFIALSELLLNVGKAKAASCAAEQGMVLLKVLGASEVEEIAALIKVSDCMLALNKGRSALMRGREAARRCTGKRGEAMALQIVAAAELHLGKRTQSLATAKQGQEVATQSGDESLIARAIRDEAAALAVLNDHEEACRRLQEAASLAAKAGNLTLQAAIHRFAADVHINKGNFKEALSSAREAVEASERQGDKRNMARGLETVGTAQGVLVQFPQATTTAQECQELYQEVGDPLGEERALELMAKLRAAQGKMDGALEAGEERLAVVRESCGPDKEADALHQVGGLHFQAGNIALAERTVKEAKSVARKAGCHGILSEILVTLAHIYLEKSDLSGEIGGRSFLDLAARACADAVAAAGKVKMLRTWGQALLFRGRAMLRLGRRTEAWRSGVDSANRCQEAGDGPGLCRAYILCGEIRIENGDLSGAQEILAQAQDIAQQCNEDELSRQAEALLDRTKIKAPVAAQPIEDDSAGVVKEEVVVQAASSVAAAPAKQGLDPVVVRKTVMKLVADAIADDGELEVDSPFMEAGMDSLSSVSLTSMLAKEFGMAMSPSLVFDFPNVRALEEHLIQEHANQ